MRPLLRLASLILAAPTAAMAFPVERCMNLGAALEAPVEGEWGYRIEAGHLRRIAAAGFDTVRLPLRVSAHWDGARVDPAFLARVDDVVAQARATGLQVILDLHHFDAFMADPLAAMGDLAGMWDALGAHLAGAPGDVLFELLNEPNDAATTAVMARANAALIARLRPAHPTRWIITGGGDWNAAAALDDLPPPGPFEARTFHYYEPWAFTHQQAPHLDDPPPPARWGSAFDRARVEGDLAAIATLDGPLFMGEFGTYQAGPDADRLAWVRAVREAAEAQGIAWCFWSFSQGSEAGFTAYDTATEDWLPGYPDALIPPPGPEPGLPIR